MGDLLRRRVDRLGEEADPGVLTVSEEHGLVDQMEHWGRRLATDDVSKYKVVDPGDVVYNIYLLWAGAIGQSSFDERRVTSPVYEVFTPTESAAPKFVGLAVQNPLLIRRFDAISIGTVGRRRRAPWKDFLDLPVLLPPVVEQQRIVDLMDSVDAAVSAAQAEVDAAVELLGSTTASIWEQKHPEIPLAEIGKLVTGKTPPTKKDEYWSPAVAPFVTPGDLGTSGQSLQLDQVSRRVSQSALEKYRASTERYTVLQVCIGSTIGKAGFTNADSLFNQQINAVVGLSESDARLLAALVSTPQHLNALRMSTGQTAVPIVNRTAWSNLTVPWPDPDIRKTLSNLVASFDTAVSTAQSVLDRLRELRSSLLTVLLSGEHQIPETYDRFLTESVEA